MTATSCTFASTSSPARPARAVGVALALAAMLCFAANIFIVRSAMQRLETESGFLDPHDGEYGHRRGAHAGVVRMAQRATGYGMAAHGCSSRCRGSSASSSRVASCSRPCARWDRPGPASRIPSRRCSRWPRPGPSPGERLGGAGMVGDRHRDPRALAGSVDAAGCARAHRRCRSRRARCSWRSCRRPASASATCSADSACINLA